MLDSFKKLVWEVSKVSIMAHLLPRVPKNFLTNTLKISPSPSTKSSQDTLHHLNKVLGLAMQCFCMTTTD